MLSPCPLQVELGLLGFIQVHKLPFAHVLDMPEADQLLVQYILNSRQTHEINLEPYPWNALFGLPLTKNQYQYYTAAFTVLLGGHTILK